MARIIGIVFGFFIGGVVGGLLAMGAFELTHPATTDPPRNDGAEERRTVALSDRARSRLDWIIVSAAVCGGIGMIATHLLLKPESEPPRPPADFKIGDPPPDLR
jgi:hypothetical protein